MDSNYDEDLSENSFFQILQSDHSEIFQTATLEGWVICVPRAGSLPKYTLSQDDFFSHILVPSDELPESHYRTLNDKEVRISNRVVNVEQNDISRPYSTHILFEETFYTDEMLKYKVLCVESPLERSSSVAVASPGLGLARVQSLRDCIDLLWTESGSKDALALMDDALREFLAANPDLELRPMQALKDAASAVYARCLRIALSDARLRDKAAASQRFLAAVQVSVETYVHHGIHKQLMAGVTACLAHDDARLNKAVRGLAGLQLRDLGVRPDLHGAVSHARAELASIDGYATALGKLGCLRRAVSGVSAPSPGNGADSGAVAADDLLPAVVFLVLKARVATWSAQLAFLRSFRFSAAERDFDCDEAGFLVTTLEAALEHIRSGVLQGSSAPEGQWDRCDDLTDEDDFFAAPPSPALGASAQSVASLFALVRRGDLDGVVALLDRGQTADAPGRVSPSALGGASPTLCHPLCTCARCEGVVTRALCRTSPTVLSCDSRGLTALHVACLSERPQLVDMLIARGSRVSAADCSGATPMHYACARGQQNALLLLAHGGAPVAAADNEGNTPLHLAADHGHEDCVKALLYFSEHAGAGLDVNAANAAGDTALHHAARWGFDAVARILLAHGARPDAANRRQATPLGLAHSLHMGRLLKDALDALPAPGLVRPRPETSAARKSLDFTETAPPEGKEPTGERGERPESTAAMRRVERLLRAVAFGDARLAAFHLGLSGPAVERNRAAPRCHPLCVCAACAADQADLDEEPRDLTQTVSVNACDADGFTALHVAAMHGHAEIARLLLDAGAKVNAQTRAQRLAPLHLAAQHRRATVARLLLAAGDVAVDLRDARGNAPLHLACAVGCAKTVELLLRAEPDRAAINAEGLTPVDVATGNTSLTLLKMLRGGEGMALT